MLHIYVLFVFVSSEGPGKIVRPRRLGWGLAAHLYNMRQMPSIESREQAPCHSKIILQKYTLCASHLCKKFKLQVVDLRTLNLLSCMSTRISMAACSFHSIIKTS